MTILSRCLSTSSAVYNIGKPSVLLVNHGYPPLFNAGSEVRPKSDVNIGKKDFRFTPKH